MTAVESVSTALDKFLNTINTYAASHQDGIIALLLFTGVIVTFSGRKLLKPTVFLLGFLPASIAIGALGLAFSHDAPEPRPVLDAIAILTALAFGILVGIIMLRLLFRIATFLLCAGFGAVLVLVAHLFLLEPATGPNAQVVLYTTAIFAALVAGLFSVSYPETGIILGTSFDGAALAVFTLARFLGHRPNVLDTAPGEASPVWAVGYGAMTLTLGIFGAMTQRQVANADMVGKADSVVRVGSDTSVPFLPEEQHLLPFEPPRTPPHLRSGVASPAGNSGYGAVDHEDSQYSVVHNLGAAPLDPGIEIDSYKNGKESNGPLPL